MRLAVLGLCAAALVAEQRISIKLPPYRREVLPNGIVLCLLPKQDAPLLNLRAIVRGGAESDPPEAAGLSSVVASMLRRGASRWTASQLSEEIDFLGASFEAHTNSQRTAISVEVMPKYADRAIELLAEAMLRPTFPESEVERVRAQFIDAARSLKDSAGAAAWQYFRWLHFGPLHPYGRPFWGDELSLRHITRALIVTHHKRMYVGANLILVAAGPFETSVMRRRLLGAFQAMPTGQKYPWVRQMRDRPAGHRLLLVDKPDATQTNFLVGFPGAHRTHRDRVAVWLANTVFGGRFTSMLNEELRVESGLTYGAYSYFGQNRLTGAIVISSFTETARTAEAIDLALGTLKEFSERGISAQQLASAKTYLKGVYPPDNLQTSHQLAILLGELEVFGLDRNEIDSLYSRIDAASLVEVNAAVRKYFTWQQLDFVLVGNAARLREIAGKYAPRVTEISINEPGLALSLEKWRSAQPPAARAPQGRIRPPRSPAKR